AERPPIGVDRRGQRLRQLEAVREIPCHDVYVIDDDVHRRLRMEIAVVNLSANDLEAIDSQRKELFDAVLPARIDAGLARLLRRSLYEVELGLVDLDVSDERAMKELSPLHGEIDAGRGEEGDRNLAGSAHD